MPWTERIPPSKYGMDMSTKSVRHEKPWELMGLGDAHKLRWVLRSCSLGAHEVFLRVSRVSLTYNVKAPSERFPLLLPLGSKTMYDRLVAKLSKKNPPLCRYKPA